MNLRSAFLAGLLAVGMASSASRAGAEDAPAAAPTIAVITAMPPRPTADRGTSTTAPGTMEAGTGAVAAAARDPLRRPGWSYELRRWMMTSRIYAAAGLPPPLPGEGLRAAGAAPRALATASPGRLPEGLVTFLLMGTDRRAQERIWRTDTLLMVFFQPETGQVGLLSVPRDLWVSIPGYGAGRINTADYLGEAAGLPPGELPRRVLAQNLGFAPDHVLRLDLEGFVRLIDALGGIDVPVDCLLEDFFFDPGNLGGEVALTLEPGIRHMDGQLALRYARSRWGSSDFERARRQQRVARSLLREARSLGTLRRVPDVWRALTPYLRADLAASDVARLALQVAKVRDHLQLRSRVLQFPDLEDWTAPDGSAVLLLHPESLEGVLADLLGPAANPATPRAAAVPVYDATGRSGWEQLVALRLGESGWAAGKLTRRAEAAESLVFHRPEAAVAAARLARDLGLGPQALRAAGDWTAAPPEAALWIQVGTDWRACPHP
ncbi:MAG: LCP family protein [Ardenticatenia bacterium]|nr:LCP family protein [Ardenticatenia bacterium]